MLNSFADRVRAFLTEDDGPTATEYAVVVALIITACLTAIGGIGTQATTVFNSLQAVLTL